MMRELINGGAWNKTSQLILDKYGKQIEFRFLAVIKTDQPYYSNGDDLIIPLNSRQQYLGDVVIHKGAHLTLSEKMDVTDLIHFLIEPFAYNLHLKTAAEGLQNQLLSEAKPIQENVIALFKNDSEQSEPETGEHKTISSIIHLHSKSPALRHKVALKIHEILESSFFVQLKDIAKGLHSVSDLASLSGATIYVDHILQLNNFELQILADFAMAQRKYDIQFLIGSDLSEKEIALLPCQDQLKKDLMGFLFEIDKVPVSQQTSRDVLELLFFSFDPLMS